MSLIVNGIDITAIEANGVPITEAFMNGISVYTSVQESNIFYVGSSEVVNNTTTPKTISPHDSTATGDLILAIFSSLDTDGTIVLNLSSGFTTVSNGWSGTSTDIRHYFQYKVRESGDTSYTFSNSSGAQSSVALLTFRGQKASPIGNIVLSNEPSNTVTQIQGTIDQTIHNSLVVGVPITKYSNVTWTASSEVDTSSYITINYSWRVFYSSTFGTKTYIVSNKASSTLVLVEVM
jgi:hypothetical protein